MGLTEQHALAITVITSVTNIGAILFIDKIGSKPLLLIGATAPIALIAANLFVGFFGISWSPVVWVMLGEMFDNKIRAMAISVAAAAQWAANFIISMTFPALADIGLTVAYGFYTLCAFLAIIFVVKFIRETKGIELEDMDKLEATYAHAKP